VATAIPKITDEFLGLDKVSWYSSAYFMTFGGFQPLWGKVMKYFSIKSSFLLAIFIFEVGSLICGVAPNATTLIVGRAIAGFGGAGIGIGGVTIMAFAVEPRKRPQYMGIFGALYGVAAITGPLLGGAFADKVSWRWCFYINLPIGGVAAVLIVAFLKSPSQVTTSHASLNEKIIQMDPLGALLIMGAIVAYILALEYGGQTKPWNSSVVIGLLVGSVVIGVVFCGWQVYLGERAMLVPRLFKQRVGKRDFISPSV
jgi:MFS transporter, DHA2 family, glioxin efflux transporter